MHLPNPVAAVVGNIYPIKTTKRIYKVKQKYVHLFNAAWQIEWEVILFSVC